MSAHNVIPLFARVACLRPFTDSIGGTKEELAKYRKEVKRLTRIYKKDLFTASIDLALCLDGSYSCSFDDYHKIDAAFAAGRIHMQVNIHINIYL